jgi:hypothetical protein
VRKLRRGKHRKKRRPTAPAEPEPNRRDAITQKIAERDRRKKQDSYDSDVQRDLDMLGWVSRPTRDHVKQQPEDDQ